MNHDSNENKDNLVLQLRYIINTIKIMTELLEHHIYYLNILHRIDAIDLVKDIYKISMNKIIEVLLSIYVCFFLSYQQVDLLFII